LKVLHVTALEVAINLFGDVREVAGDEDHPLIMAALRMAAEWPEHDEVPWCSSVPYMVSSALGLPKPEVNGLMARSWLTVGEVVPLEEARPGFDLAIFSRGDDPPGPEVLRAPGHVAYFYGLMGSKVLAYGGNQDNSFNLGFFPTHRLLGIRRVM